MSHRIDLLSPFSHNWAEALTGTVHSVGGRALHLPGAVALDVGRPAGLMNSVVLLQPPLADAVASLMAALDVFFAFNATARAGTVFMFTVWPVPDLTPFGWVCVEQMPLMARPPTEDASPAPPGLRISEVRSAQDLHHFEQVMVKGFPVPELEGLPAGSAIGPSILQDERFRFWLGWHDGQPVSASAAYVAHGVVDLIFLATLPQVRGRGFGSALARTATVVEPGLPAMLIASDDGQPVYARLGYQHVCDMPLWIRERS